ncbi:Hint domain-containing protein [Roseovarius sp.]|uniref:Hint domain-containing protein n=1 Tax=Roseovarius sp. TaxID=1486281 RepID=UPI003BA94150
MGADNTPIPDLIEISGITVNTTFTVEGTGGGTIHGVVDNATYSDNETGNSATHIGELNETQDADNGVLTIDGVEYSIELVTPTGSSGGDVTYTLSDGSTGTIAGNGDDSDIVFIVASPTGGGETRYFAVMDDSLGDVAGITSLTTGDLDYDPAGDDVMIDVEQNNAQTVICFCAGTLIDTPEGPRAVETLRPNDRVATMDRGAQAVLWTSARTLAPEALAADPRLRPVRIGRGALRPGRPARDLYVSPQHRIWLRSRIAARMFGTAEVLVPAIKLTGLPGVAQVSPEGPVRYHHLLCRRHEIVFAEGLPCETLLRAERAGLALSGRGRTAWALLRGAGRGPARPIRAKGATIDRLVARHVKNRKPLIPA